MAILFATLVSEDGPRIANRPSDPADHLLLRSLPCAAIAGREDIDVRMLGQGRPFILEIHNARRRVAPPRQLQQLEARVAEVGGCAAGCVA